MSDHCGCKITDGQLDESACRYAHIVNAYAALDKKCLEWVALITDKHQYIQELEAKLNMKLNAKDEADDRVDKEKC